MKQMIDIYPTNLRCWMAPDSRRQTAAAEELVGTIFAKKSITHSKSTKNKAIKENETIRDPFKNRNRLLRLMLRRDLGTILLSASK